ncbi:MAG: radical SAM family heme chaperone HemW [Pseudomonadota bacterium]
MNNLSKKPPGLYVHIPFCRSKCPYCSFYSTASAEWIPAWLEALKKEVLHYGNRFGTFDTLYLGGGTPTVLPVRTLAEVMGHLFAHFDFLPDREVTLEANPGGLSRDKIKALKGLGVNRVSLGVQSFEDRHLLFLGRGHTGLEAERAVSALRASGFDNVGLDLIYGMEGQSLKAWINTLKKALEFRPEHLSCYQLSIERGTPFWGRKKRGRIMGLEEEDERTFFLATSRFLEDQGYIHYEVSNFAREEVFKSRHNTKYWDHTPYLGLGPSAHSFGRGVRWWNVRSVRRYCEALSAGRRPVEDRECLTPEQLRLESVALGFRTSEGFPQGEISEDIPAGERLSLLEREGFLRVQERRVLPTRKGLLVADRLPTFLLEG